MGKLREEEGMRRYQRGEGRGERIQTYRAYSLQSIRETKQNKTKQNKTKQNKTKQIDNTSDHTNLWLILHLVLGPVPLGLAHSTTRRLSSTRDVCCFRRLSLLASMPAALAIGPRRTDRKEGEV